jgi:hypothetical protein
VEPLFVAQDSVPVDICSLQKMSVENPPPPTSPWWETYAREHVWSHAAWIVLERGKCDDCGKDGRPSKAEIAALGPMRNKNTWTIAREALQLKHALIVVHARKLNHDIGFDGCHHHLDNLLVLCAPCAAKRAQ